MGDLIEIVAADPHETAPVAVRVAVVDAYDAPVAFRLRDTEAALGKSSIAEVRAHRNALWRRFGERYGHPGLSGHAAIAAAAADPDRHDNPFGAGPDVPPAERARGLLVVEGDLWERVPEPVAVLVDDPEGGIPYIAFRWEGPTDPAATFRIDEVELAASCARSPVATPFVQVLMPECVRHDARGALLAAAAREVAGHLLASDPDAPLPAALAAAASGVVGARTLEDILDAALPIGEAGDYPPALVAAVTRAAAEPMPVDEWDGPEPPEPTTFTPR